MIHGLQPSLAEAGKIKIGGLGEKRKTKTGREWRAPQKYDAFEVTGTSRNAQGDLVVDGETMAALPHDPDGKVRSIPIILHSDDIEAVFPTAYACYDGRAMLCRGDGEKAQRWNPDRTVKSEMACPCPYLGASSGPICKPHGTLHCSIAIPGRAVAGAVHRWRTTSIISIQRMVGSLQQILATVGVLRGVPLTLRVEPVQVSPQGKATTVFCCHVELRATDLLDVQQRALDAAKMRSAVANGVDVESQYKRLVAAPGLGESPEEEAEIAEEFHAAKPPEGLSVSRAKELQARLTKGPTLDQVLAAIDEAKTAEQLRRAGEMCRQLTSVDKKVAVAAGVKRQMEMDAFDAAAATAAATEKSAL